MCIVGVEVRNAGSLCLVRDWEGRRENDEAGRVRRTEVNRCVFCVAYVVMMRLGRLE
jgi:hypothetical protein